MPLTGLTINPTEDFVPYRNEGTFKDSPAKFDDVNNIIIVSVPVLSPRKFTKVSETYTVLPDEDDLIQCTSNTFTVTLPTAVGIEGTEFEVKNSGVGVITLDGDGSETIDGSLTKTLSFGDSIKVASDGANWIITT